MHLVQGANRKYAMHRVRGVAYPGQLGARSSSSRNDGTTWCSSSGGGSSSTARAAAA
jgi:hypothetical protein